MRSFGGTLSDGRPGALAVLGWWESEASLGLAFPISFETQRAFEPSDWASSTKLSLQSHSRPIFYPATQVILHKKRSKLGFQGIIVEAMRALQNHLPRKSELVVVSLGMLPLLAFSMHCCHEELAVYPVCCWLFPAHLEWTEWKGFWHPALIGHPTFPHSAQSGLWV